MRRNRTSPDSGQLLPPLPPAWELCSVLPPGPLSGRKAHHRRKERMQLRTVVGAVELWVWHGQEPEEKRWSIPIREWWGLAPHQRMSPAMEEKLAFTATLAGAYADAALLANKRGSEVDHSVIYALETRVKACTLPDEVCVHPRERFMVAAAPRCVLSQPFNPLSWRAQAVEPAGWFVQFASLKLSRSLPWVLVCKGDHTGRARFVLASTTRR